MSHFNRNTLAILPLLTLMSVAPAKFGHYEGKRGIASVEAEFESLDRIAAYRFPLYEAERAKIKPGSLYVNKSIDLEQFRKKGEEFDKKLSSVRADFNVKELNPSEIECRKQELQELVIGLAILEEDAKVLHEKKAWFNQSKSDLPEQIAMTTMKELKQKLESLLCDQEDNDAYVKLQKEKEKKEEVVVKKEEPKKEEPKKEESPLLCELEEKNKVLTKQVEELVEQQKQIMQSMMLMTQMMMQMAIKEQQNPLMNQLVPYNQQYPTQAQTASGNWVFYPNGFNPQSAQVQQQSPIQIQLQMPGQQQQGPQAFYPDQFLPTQGQGLNSWAQPAYDPRFSQPMSQYPGQFGSSPFSYNFSNRYI